MKIKLIQTVLLIFGVTTTLIFADPSVIADESLKNGRTEQGVVCELLTEQNTFFQGEPFIVTLKITVCEQIYDICLKDKMNFSGFSFKNFGQQKNHQELRNNKSVDIIEQKFVLASLQYGNKIINPVTVVYQVQVKTRRESRNAFGFGFFGYSRAMYIHNNYGEMALSRRSIVVTVRHVDIKLYCFT
ncbi:MAG: hypothetical protein US22_C0052G0001 [candidate division TM6 bacterium GW2011_GWF2_36_6]|nr:MAG: hypothetical protein US22_C0052G0001 [candidate division TM6 bacterium GW2011_GWF2_36_6]